MLDLAATPERLPQPDLGLHDPPQLTRPPDLELPQPLHLTPTPTSALMLVRERSRHPRQIRDRGHPRTQPLADVLMRRRPPQILEPPPRPRRLRNQLQLPHRGAQPDHRLPRERLLIQRETPPVHPPRLQLLERRRRAAPGSPAATTGRHQPQRSARPCRGSPAPDRRSAHSSRSCDQAPPTAHADRTPPARSRLSAPLLAPLQQPVEPPLRRQHLNLRNPLVRRRVVRRPTPAGCRTHTHATAPPACPGSAPPPPAPSARSPSDPCHSSSPTPAGSAPPAAAPPGSTPRSSPCPYAQRHSNPNYLILAM